MRWLIVAVFAISAVGCAQGVPDGAQRLFLATDPPHASGDGGCPLELGGGTLLRDERTGFAFGITNVTEPVIWPYGYTAALVDGAALLVDPAGHIVAKEGDLVEATGWGGGDSGFHACTAVQRVGSGN